MTDRTRRIVTLAMPWIAMAVLLIVWELACIVFDLPEIILPRPTKVFAVFVQRIDILLAFCWDTLWTTVLGFLIAIAGGMLLGVLIGASPLIYSGLYPLLIAFNAVPKVAIVPILMIWVGVGALPAVITAFVISFFPIVVNVATGLATIEPEMIDVLKSLGASRFEILRKVGIPRAMPYLFASLKVAITLAFIGSVISETGGGNPGGAPSASGSAVGSNVGAGASAAPMVDIVTPSAAPTTGAEVTPPTGTSGSVTVTR